MVETYLGLIKKYPEITEDILILRKTKEKGLYIFCEICTVIGLVSGIIIMRVIL